MAVRGGQLVQGRGLRSEPRFLWQLLVLEEPSTLGNHGASGQATKRLSVWSSWELLAMHQTLPR